MTFMSPFHCVVGDCLAYQHSGIPGHHKHDKLYLLLSLRITQIFYWTFFRLELHLYHALPIKLIKKSPHFYWTDPDFYWTKPILLDLSDSLKYFVETVSCVFYSDDYQNDVSTSIQKFIH